MISRSRKIPPQAAAAAKKRIIELFSNCSFDCDESDGCSSYQFKATGKCQCLDDAEKVIYAALDAWPHVCDDLGREEGCIKEDDASAAGADS